MSKVIAVLVTAYITWHVANWLWVLAQVLGGAAM